MSYRNLNVWQFPPIDGVRKRSRREMFRKTWNLYAVNGMYYITMSLFSPYISTYYAVCGMDKSQIGVLSAIIPLSSLLIQPIWAHISDKTGKRKRILLLLCIGSSLSVLLFLFANQYEELLFTVLLYAVFYSALLPLSDALTLKAAEKANVDFSRIRMSGTLSYALVVVFIGFYLKKNLRAMFVLNSISFLVFMLCCLTLRDDDTNYKRNRKEISAETRKDEPLFKSKGIIVVLTCAFALQLSLNYHGTFLGVYLLELGYNQTIIGILSCISALSEVPALLVIKKMQKNFSTVTLLIFAVSLGAVRLVLVSSGSIALIVAEHLLQGFSFMVCYMTCVTYINEQVQRDRISQGQSMLSLAQNGLGAICGTLLGGVIAEALGIQKGFQVMAVITFGITICAAVGGMWIQNKERRRSSITGEMKQEK